MRSWGRHLRHALIAGLSGLALAACGILGAPDAGSTQQQALPAPPDTFSLTPPAELTADMPHLTADGDRKAYAAAFIHWVLTPGHMIERSRMLGAGAPPDLDDAAEFSRLVRTLSEEGDVEAKIFRIIGSGDDIDLLMGSDHPTAKFFLQTRRLHQGSLQQKIDALGWLRKEAATNRDAAFALGGFLIDQGASPEYLGPTVRMLATPAEVAEGTRLLKTVAAHTTLESMVHIADLLQQTLDTPAGDAVVLRKLLELTVAATSPTPSDESVAISGISQEFGDTGGQDATYQAASLRVALAELLESGKGGPADIERARALYMEALTATQDRDALRALKRLGVDVTAYEPKDEDAGKPPARDGDGWEDQ